MFKRAIFLMSILVMMAGFAYAQPPAEVPKTGQTEIYYAGDDGDIQAGVAWPSPRFEVTYCDASGPCGDQSSDCDGNPSNDVVYDGLTDLTWAMDANLPGGTETWQEALDYVDTLNESGLCGQTDWRLPNVNELQSLIDFSQFNPCLPSENPFINVTNEEGDWCWYWSSTTYAYNKTFAWDVSMGGGPMGGGLPGCRL